MKIDTKLRVFGPALVLATAALVISIVYVGYGNLLLRERSDTAAAHVSSESERFVLAIRSYEDDVLFVANLPAVAELIESPASGSASSAAADRIAGQFEALMKTRSEYDQIRIIGFAGEGRELIRVQRGLAGPERVSDEDLQSKTDESYFAEMARQPPGKLYASQITLNREMGAIEVPHRPMLRIGTLLSGPSGERFGFAIINISFDNFVRRLIAPSTAEGFHYLTNQSGDFIYHPNPSLSFGFDVGDRHLLQQTFPEIAGILDSGPATTVSAIVDIAELDGESLIHARRVYPFRDYPMRFLTIVFAAPVGAIAVPSTEVVGGLVIALIVLLLGAVSAAYVVSSHLTGPLRELAGTADRISHGETTEFQFVHRDDELGTLSRALSLMVNSLHDHQRSLADAYHDLEHFSKLASHDLSEPARRVAALASLLDSKDFELDESDRARILDDLKGEGEALVRQLSDLRAFNRLAETVQVRSEVDMRDVVEAAIAANQPDLATRNGRTQVDFLPRATVYVSLAELLYSMLIRFVLEHGPEGRANIWFSSAIESEETEFIVSTEPVDKVRLFERGSPLSTASLVEEEGARLALSICQRIVERHSGQMRVCIEPGLVAIAFTLSDGEKNE